MSMLTTNLVEALENAVKESLQEAMGGVQIFAQVEKAIKLALDEVNIQGIVDEVDIQNIVDEMDIQGIVDEVDIQDIVEKAVSKSIEDRSSDLQADAAVWVDRAIGEANIPARVQEAVEAFRQSEEWMEMLGDMIGGARGTVVEMVIEDSDFLENLAEHVALILESNKPLSMWQRAWNWLSCLWRTPSITLSGDSK